MSKKQFRSQASSSRAVSGVFGGSDGGLGGGAFGSAPTFGATSPSSLSYIYEPPDLSTISVPNVVVAFKSLQKKDSTTKSKALEELQAYVLSLKPDQGGVEDSILEAWITLYPRTSIDSARRVRQLAHLFQGHISASCGKRIAKSMPKVVGPWLAGLYDNDRSVSRAAQESLKQVFSSEDKLANLWRLYQAPIIVHSLDAITKETVNTLSDERTTSPDDALAKHARVVATSILMVTRIIDDATADSIAKHKSLLDEFLADNRAWNFASHADPFVRRGVYRLLFAALTKVPESLDMKTISTNILASSLHVDQLGSAYDYARALASVTKACPEVWTTYYTGSGKKSALKRLCQFLRKGSQGSVPEYWSQISVLLCHLPEPLFDPLSKNNGKENSADDAVALQFPILDAIHSGICSKDEPRPNLPAAWTTYLEVNTREQHLFVREDAMRPYYRGYLLPIIQQYITPSQEWSQWITPRSEQPLLCVEVFLQLWQLAEALIQEEWQILSEKVIENMRSSLPEQSKDFAMSQETVADESFRWYSLQAAIMRKDTSQSIKTLFLRSSSSELPAAIDLLKSRNGKPYGAAATLVAAVQLTPELINSNAELKRTVVSFVQVDISNLFMSPSASYFITLLGLMEGEVDVRQPYRDCLESLQEAPESYARSNILESVLSSDHLSLADNDKLSKIVGDYLEAVLAGNSSGWETVLAAINNPAAPAGLVHQVLFAMADAIATTDRVSAGLHGMKMLIQSSQRSLQLLSTFLNESQSLSRLLTLATSQNDDIVQNAQSIMAALERHTASGQSSEQASRSRRDIINKGLEPPTKGSLPVAALLGQAQKLFEQAEEHDKAAVTAGILPNWVHWREARSPLLDPVPSPSLAITSPLSCAVSLIKGPPTSTASTRPSVSRDAGGFSSTFRVLCYVTKLLNENGVISYCSQDEKITICENLLLILQVAGDQIAMPSKHGLWDASMVGLEDEVVNLITEAQHLVASWMQERLDFVIPVQQRLLDSCRGRSVLSYYSARAYLTMTAELKELHGNTPDDVEMALMQSLPKSVGADYIFRDIALLASASESKHLTRLANEFLSSLTGHGFVNQDENGLCLLLLLNCILHRQDEIISAIPQQRLVFFVKHMVSESQDHALAGPVRTEIFRAFTVVLPRIKDLYGDFWDAILSSIREAWSNQQDPKNSDIPLINTSLRLLSVLRTLAAQDSNDDLQETLADGETLVDEGLVGLVKHLQGLSDESDQPRMITNQLLSRQLAKLPPRAVSNPEELYQVLASDSVALQLAAYRILHDHIPKAQEQVSLDKALTKGFTARLPEELLSLVLASPTQEIFLIADLQKSMPAPLRTYLLSWKLVYDHWKGSSYAVQADYAASLKEGEYLKTLLDFMFDYLITGRSRPVDPSKFDIMEFSPEQEDNPERDAQFFLVYLYTLSLQCVPNLSKSWWRDSTSRQTMLAVESWTEKYVASQSPISWCLYLHLLQISPIIIASELNTVSLWGPSQADADQPLSVKVSTSTREITASIPIDEQTMSIAIRMPSSYPLSRATVESIHRVGVDERKWRSWIITTQGVINFSNEGNGGALIEGLLAWRKNVTATMKGQTECAICYSVVSAERQLPSKKCGTCRNMFHGGCLYRWFKSSNSSSCPLCRNAFNYA